MCDVIKKHRRNQGNSVDHDAVMLLCVNQAFCGCPCVSTPQFCMYKHFSAFLYLTHLKHWRHTAMILTVFFHCVCKAFVVLHV